ncbi:hypothetical protein GCM10020221_21520 [Streptomyces thioluteus]|uniref:MFS transporter n=1 Tax=Streptomyces thioluteus TaxID=66431 RepID=A0ABN3WR83_STRTU
MDVYQGAVAALVPFFVSERHYGYAAASGVVLAASLLSSVVQPLFGALTDGGACVAAAGEHAGGGRGHRAGRGRRVVPRSPSCWSPCRGSASPRTIRRPRGRPAARPGAITRRWAWFSLGGNIGFAAAPLLVAAVVATGGLGASPLLAVPALVAAVLYVAVPRTDPRPGTAAAGHADGREDDRASFARLTGAIMCRSVVFVGLSAFVSLYVRERVGGGEVAGTAALFVLYLGGAVGTVAGGRLANRYSRVTVVRRSYALSVLAVAGVVLVPGRRSTGSSR